MIEREDFINLLEKVADAFGLKKGDSFGTRAAVYFDALKYVDHATLEKTFKRVIDDDERFPSISRVKEICFLFQKERPKGSCDKCAEGWVLMWKHAFKCHCEHGKKLYKHAMLAPLNKDERRQVYGRLNAEYKELYGKDLVEGFSYVVSSKTELSPIVHKAVDMFGATVTSISGN